jgi:phage terminase small subunit
MAGVKGRSGGARANSGGARPGAGRKPKPKPEPVLVVASVNDEAPAKDDTLKLLQDIAFGRIDASPIQVRAAIAAVQYTHVKKGDGGKRDEAQERAEKAASKFAPSAPPRLVVSR